MIAERDLRIQSLLLISAILDPLADPSRVGYGTEVRIVTPAPDATATIVAADTGVGGTHVTPPRRAGMTMGDPATRRERLAQGPLWRLAEERPFSAVRLLGSDVSVALLPVTLRFIVHVVVSGTTDNPFALWITITSPDVADEAPLFTSDRIAVRPWPLDRAGGNPDFALPIPVVAVPTLTRTGVHRVAAWIDDREASWLPLMVRTG